MQVIVLANELQKEALINESVKGLIWIENENAFLQHADADAFLHLVYSNTEERSALLSQLLPKPVVINSVTDTLQEINNDFVRINGWNTFLSSTIIEAACNNEEVKRKAADVFLLFQKKLEWLPDDPGFVAARVVSMIVNEAYLALADGVSTKDEINTAMKLGTAYPYGPFEWAEKIGVQNIVTLLAKLGKTQPRYVPSSLLIQEAAKRL